MQCIPELFLSRPLMPFVGSLQRFEIPQRLKLTDEVWTPDTGLITDSLKLKRKPLNDYYAAVVRELYA